MSASDSIGVSNSDTVGPDGTVRLRRYLPLADRHWFSAECEDQEGCGHAMPIGIAAAIVLTGSDDATVRQLAPIPFTLRS